MQNGIPSQHHEDQIRTPSVPYCRDARGFGGSASNDAENRQPLGGLHVLFVQKFLTKYNTVAAVEN